MPQPQYTIMREPVDGNLPDFLVMEIQLPGIVSCLEGKKSDVGVVMYVLWGYSHPYSQGFIEEPLP